MLLQATSNSSRRQKTFKSSACRFPNSNLTGADNSSTILSRQTLPTSPASAFNFTAGSTLQSNNRGHRHWKSIGSRLPFKTMTQLCSLFRGFHSSALGAITRCNNQTFLLAKSDYALFLRTPIFQIDTHCFQCVDGPFRKLLIRIHRIHKIVNKLDKGSSSNVLSNGAHQPQLVSYVMDSE